MHDHSHQHGHHHGHDHGHGKDFGRAFAIGTALNLSFVAIEAGYGIVTGSVALQADAGHNFSDVIGLVLAWGAATLAKRDPSVRYTYGLRGSSIMAALLNSLLLLVAVTLIAAEAVQRFTEPQPVPGTTIMIVAAIGILINGGTAMLFMRGAHGDLNVRAAFLHMMGDALVSVGVVAGGFAILKTGWLWIDPVLSLVIVAVIAVSGWGVLRDAVNMSLHAVPARIDPEAVASFLRARDGVADLHDLHIWSMSTTETALTAHLLVPGGYPGDAFVQTLAQELEHEFDIDHVTIQLETSPDTACGLKPANVV